MDKQTFQPAEQTPAFQRPGGLLYDDITVHSGERWTVSAHQPASAKRAEVGVHLDFRPNDPRLRAWGFTLGRLLPAEARLMAALLVAGASDAEAIDGAREAAASASAHDPKCSHLKGLEGAGALSPVRRLTARAGSAIRSLCGAKRPSRDKDGRPSEETGHRPAFAGRYRFEPPWQSSIEALPGPPGRAVEGRGPVAQGQGVEGKGAASRCQAPGEIGNLRVAEGGAQ